LLTSIERIGNLQSIGGRLGAGCRDGRPFGPVAGCGDSGPY